MAEFQPVWPGFIAYGIGLLFAWEALFIFAMASFQSNDSNIWLFYVIMAISAVFTFMVNQTHFDLAKNRTTEYFFHGYQRIGKVVGAILMLFGNVGLYYFPLKSVTMIFVFLILGFYFVCALFLTQPYTDFGMIDFLLSASLNDALTIYGIRHVNSWLVLIACACIGGLRYWLEPNKKSDEKIGGRFIYRFPNEEDPLWNTEVTAVGFDDFILLNDVLPIRNRF